MDLLKQGDEAVGVDFLLLTRSEVLREDFLIPLGLSEYRVASAAEWGKRIGIDR